MNVHSGPFYGAAEGGGAYGGGAFFSLTVGGKEHVLYSFKEIPRSQEFPDSTLTSFGGLFYGWTTSALCNFVNGKKCGFIFSVSKSGVEKAVYTFDKPDEGLEPSSLTVLNGVLYGTTIEGGAISGDCAPAGCGVVFSLSASGVYHRLYSFNGSYSFGPDGADPDSLVALNGTLYGTTSGGGTAGQGTVFSLTPEGTERVLYSFKGGSGGDGSFPNGIAALNGTFYGTTRYGGGTCSHYGMGCGTAFSITPGGAYQILYHFAGGNDGFGPRANLEVLNGVLYGTTYFGGNGCPPSYYVPGCGTVFSLTTAGQETVLHSFEGGNDGRLPSDAALIPVKETLYGTTGYGGAYLYYGTAYALTP